LRTDRGRRGLQLEIDASIGIALSPEHGTDADTLLRRADVAMYIAKAKGKARFVQYEASIAGAAIERMWLSFDLLAGPWLNVRGGYLEAAVVPFSRYTHNLSYEGYLPFEAAGPAGLAAADAMRMRSKPWCL